MCDPLVVDVFAANYKRIMPVEEAARILRRKPSAARASRSPPPEVAGGRRASGADTDAFNEVLTISSLARAVSGNASALRRPGALAWMTLRNVIPAARWCCSWRTSNRT